MAGCCEHGSTLMNVWEPQSKGNFLTSMLLSASQDGLCTVGLWSFCNVIMWKAGTEIVAVFTCL